MRTFKATKKYKKDFNKLNNEILEDELTELLDKIAIGIKPDRKYKNHKLRGDQNNKIELHVRPDLLLIYEIRNDVIILYRLGSHSELFKK